MREGPRSDRLVGFASRAYAVLLWLLPSDLRAAESANMKLLFGRIAEEARAARGAMGVVAVWWRSAWDVAAQAVRARWAPRAGTRGDRAGSGRFGAVLDGVVMDARQSARALIRKPGFLLVGSATFALGIGATTAMFGVVHGVLLRELPYGEPDRIVRLMGTRRGELNRGGTLSYLNARDVAERGRLLQPLAAYDEWRPNLTGSGEPESISAALVNVEFFRVLGVEPAVGRFFIDEEDQDGRDAVVVLGHGLWQRRFGSDPGIVGRTIDLNGYAHTVVGVTPRDFEDPGLSGDRWAAPALWRPLGLVGLPPEEQPSRGSSSYVAIGRLVPGATIDQARAELASISTALAEEYPEENETRSMTAEPLRETLVGDVRMSLLLVLGAVGLLLAIAAANVGNLLLARASERRQEVALRSALGAGRGRIVRQLATEAVVLALPGGVIGVALAWLCTGLLVRLGGDFIPRSDAVGIDPAVLAFAFAVTLGTGLVCGLVPALLAGRSDLRSVLAENARGGSQGRATARFRTGLVVSEVALALVLLVGAALLGRSLWKLMNVDVGIRTDDLLTFELAPPALRYPEYEQVHAFYADLLARLERLPGVRAAELSNLLPLSGGFDCNTARAADRPEPPASERFCPEVRTVTPGYFAAVAQPLLHGRLPGGGDRDGTPAVAVITPSTARALWPGENPVGRRMIVVDTVVEVIGVVGDVKHMRLEDEGTPMIYVPYAQGLVGWHTRAMAVVVATDRPPLWLADDVRGVIRALDAELPITNVRTMESIVADSTAPPRFRTFLLVSFAALALLLASIGIYGVVSYTVARRTREMAIRLSLGARTGEVRALVVKQGLVPVVLGLAFGSLAALALSRLLAAVLFDVPPTDPLVFLSVPVLLFAVAAVACAIPATRAARVTPMSALRQE